MNRVPTTREAARLMTTLSPEALHTLERLAELRSRPPEDVLRDEIERRLRAELPILNLDGIILAMADRFREAGFVVGVAKGLVRRWSEGR